MQSALIPQRPFQSFVVLTIALALAACGNGGSDETTTGTLPDQDSPTTIAELVSDGSEEAATTVAPSEAPEVSTTDAPTEPVVLAVGADGYYPWLFPSPTLSWYEEGCASPESVIGKFMSNFFDEPDPSTTSLSASSHPNERRFVVHDRGEGGTPLDTGTELVLEVADVAVVDCEAWVITAAASHDLQIDAVSFSANESGGAQIDVTGAGAGFEALIDLRAHDESFRTVADGFATAGNEGLVPFAGSLSFNQEIIDDNLMIIASAGTAGEGTRPRFAATKARCCDGLEVVPPALESGRPAAVVGVAFDDTLNVRAAAGVDNPIIGQLSPFELGVRILDTEPVEVAGATWIEVFHDTRSERLRGWVNSSFIAPVEGINNEVLLDAATDVREALSLNSPVDRLADVLAGQGADSVMISVDGYLADEDQVLTLDDLGTRGTDADVARQWGVTDGKGDPIIATIAEHFAEYARLSSVNDTRAIGANDSFIDSTTINNVTERFPGAAIVELHNPGTNSFDWSTLRLAFELDDGNAQLLAIVRDTWTI